MQRISNDTIKSKRKISLTEIVTSKLNTRKIRNNKNKNEKNNIKKEPLRRISKLLENSTNINILHIMYTLCAIFYMQYMYEALTFLID